jgi:hypothetical protein
MALMAWLAVNAHAQGHWTYDPHAFPNTMTVIGVVHINGVEIPRETMELGAFCGDECRGSEMLTYFEGLGRYMVFLTLYGASGHTLSFRLYDHATQQELELTPPETIQFVPNDIVGSVLEPYVFSFTGSIEAVADQTVSCPKVYPNPIRDKVMVEGDAIETVKVYNVLGQLVIAKECGNTEKVEIDLNHLAPGVYSFLMRNKNALLNKVVLKE